MAYTDQRLEELMADLESELVERKRSAADRGAIRKAMCAFANDLHGYREPGLIFVGLEDVDGSCANLDVDDELLSLLANMRGDGNIQPLPTVSVAPKTLRGCRVAVMTVHPALDPPVRYQGRVYVRVGPTVQLASPDDERRLAERRRAADLTFDRRPIPAASLADLDLDYFRTQYLIRAVAADILEQNRRTEPEQLEALRLTLGGVPTAAALLALGKDPQRWVPGAYVQFLRLDGSEVTAPILDQKELTGRLEDVLTRLDVLLEINISVRTDVKSEAREIRRPDYPIVALQQYVRNAIMHRVYEGTNSPVRVYWYADRVEITNPGGLYGQVTPQNFGTGATDYRNPLIAEAMYHLGFAQRFGIGLALARESLRDNGNPDAVFEFQHSAVSITLRGAA